eukprot:TRINITY_DN17383_c0_g1_i4.p1 TRINITY_DN17383_c0_g1~~TRINITY_DN17383_c0_g1_i4.p1  ORF type:complete len:365 (+),score=67.50 TRINITY_DN17383_c0_g1_i4:68-1162(+)
MSYLHMNQENSQWNNKPFNYSEFWWSCLSKAIGQLFASHRPGVVPAYNYDYEQLWMTVRAACEAGHAEELAEDISRFLQRHLKEYVKSSTLFTIPPRELVPHLYEAYMEYSACVDQLSLILGYLSDTYIMPVHGKSIRTCLQKMWVDEVIGRSEVQHRAASALHLVDPQSHPEATLTVMRLLLNARPDTIYRQLPALVARYASMPNASDFHTRLVGLVQDIPECMSILNQATASTPNLWNQQSQGLQEQNMMGTQQQQQQQSNSRKRKLAAEGTTDVGMAVGMGMGMGMGMAGGQGQDGVENVEPIGKAARRVGTGIGERPAGVGCSVQTQHPRGRVDNMYIPPTSSAPTTAGNKMAVSYSAIM